MTHYMELLATNQPWNLMIFMAVPLLLAEFIAVTELVILLRRDTTSLVKRLNGVAGILVGMYFLAIASYLILNAAIPLTIGGGWRGIADVIAVGFYLLGAIPLGGIALLELGVVQRGRTALEKLPTHAMLVGVFLIVGHVAMIFGMLDPSLLTWT
jgi:hypothetical protein